MFIGHNAIGFASRRAARRTSLGTLMAAAMFLDLVWPVMLLLGFEHVRLRPGGRAFLTLEFTDYPWTHSLIAAAMWSVLFGACYFAFTRYGRGAIVTAIAVFSHWILDFVTHVPDLPLWPGGEKVGLAMWRSTTATVVVESLLFIAGIAVYARTTRARDRIGSVGFAAFVAVLALIYVANLTAKPPADIRLIGWVGISAILFPIWAWWFDSHRELRA